MPRRVATEPFAKEVVPSKAAGAPLKEFGKFQLHDPDHWIGSTIQSRYQILDKIGSGGTGTVYRAVDKRNGDFVAIKLMPLSDGTREKVVPLSECFRLLREMKAAMMMIHPNIVKTKDVGVFMGNIYIVMEHLQGEDLSKLIRRENGIPWEHARDIILRICDGLDALHKKGIVHRDLKPSNIFIANENGKEVVKLIDFGLVKFTGTTARERNLTDSDDVVGTPAYISPEMARGEEVNDPRSDLYSLGVTLYELMSGSLPFKARNYFELFDMHNNAKPPPLREKRPYLDIPFTLEAIIMKALEKNPKDRYQSVAELRAAVECLPYETKLNPLARLAEFFKIAFGGAYFLLRSDDVIGNLDLNLSKGAFDSIDKSAYGHEIGF